MSNEFCLHHSGIYLHRIQNNSIELDVLFVLLFFTERLILLGLEHSFFATSFVSTQPKFWQKNIVKLIIERHYHHCELRIMSEPKTLIGKIWD